MSSKTVARDKMLALVESQGWKPDPSATIFVNKYSRERKQDPYTFLRPARHGGIAQFGRGSARDQRQVIALD